MTTPKVKTVRIGGDRWYVDPVTGDKVPGVSSVKDTLAKPGLLFGAVKVAAAYAVDNVTEIASLAETDRGAAIDLVKRAHTRAWAVKASEGTGVHAIVEDLLNGKKGIRVSPQQRKFIVQYAIFVKEFDVRALYVEATVWNSTVGYAGTLDTILELSLTQDQAAMAGLPPQAADKAVYRAIVDTKTGASGVWSETALQQVAYKNAEYILSPNGDREEMPYVDFTGALWLRPDGFAFFPLDSGPATWAAFKGLRDAYYWDKQIDSVGLGLNQHPLQKKWSPS